MLQSEKSLPLCWNSFWGDSSDVIASVFPHEGGPYFHYVSQRPSLLWITWLTRPKIIDVLLTLIFRMGQEACRFLFWLYRRPMPHFWMSATNRHSDFPRCQTNKRWRSIDAHFQDGAESMSLSVLIIQAANTSKKTMRYQLLNTVLLDLSRRDTKTVYV